MSIISAVAAPVMTRPADTTAYTSGDLVANSTTAGSVTLLNFTMPSTSFKVQRAGIVKSTATSSQASFRLHLYSSGPTVANGDNAAWSTSAAGYLGDIDIDCSTRTFTDTATGLGLSATSQEPLYLNVPAGLVVYGLLEARSSYVPGSAETFTVTLYGEYSS